jgi:protein required for attachment to host cells
MNKESWLLVANGSQATIYKYIAHGASLQEIVGVANGARRLKDEDLVTDRPGTIAPGGGMHGQSSLTQEVSPTDKAKQDFAKDVVDQLEDARRQDKLHAVDIIAAPEMLGLMRDSMNSNLLKLIDKTVSKDGSEKSIDELLKLINK